MDNLTPLIQKYFSKFGDQLQSSQQEMKDFRGRFTQFLLDPEMFEARLQAIDFLGLTEGIVEEVGTHGNVVDLDARLMDAWAEIRTLSQLVREGFTNVRKVTEIADFTADRQGTHFAVQVTRLRKILGDEVYRNPPILQNPLPHGTVADISARLETPLWKLFHKRIEEKNSKFKKWVGDETRLVVLVNSEEQLQDDLVRHMSCRIIKQILEGFTPRYIDELLWLPDTADGAWFVKKQVTQKFECWAGWHDHAGDPLYGDPNINRYKVDLSSSIPL